MVGYTPDADFAELTDKDHTVELVGYVDEITATADVGKGKQYKLFKFVLNNNGTKRIQCLIWGDELIEKYQPQIRIQQILHIDGGHSKALQSAFHREAVNLVPFELMIQKTTKVEFLGEHVLIRVREIAAVDVPFNNQLLGVEGRIRIRGFIKTEFTLMPNRYNSMIYGCGSITNGVNKISINIANYAPQLEFAKGTAVVVVGEVKIVAGNIIEINCSSSSDIEADNDINPITPAPASRGNQVFKRRRED